MGGRSGVRRVRSRTLDFLHKHKIPMRKISINQCSVDGTSACFYGRDVKIYGTDIWNGPLAAFTLQETDGLNLGRTKCKR